MNETDVDPRELIQSLDIRRLLQAFRRRLKLILAVPVIAALVSGLISFVFIPPMYSASATLWVARTGQANNDTMASAFASVAKSQEVMVSVINQLGLKDVKVADLQSRVTVTPTKGAQTVAFTVEDRDPATAAKAADAVAGGFRAQIAEHVRVDKVTIVDRSKVPSKPIRPRTMNNIAVAAILGIIVSTILAFLLEYLNTSIKSAQDVERHVGLPVLGLIPALETANAEAVATKRRRRYKSHHERTAVEK